MIRNIAAYHFTRVEDAPALAQAVEQRARTCELLGSILIAPEGINLFLAGEDEDIAGFVAWLRADPRFVDLQCKDSWSQRRPFARLKVKLKAEIIAFRKPESSPLPARAPVVTPAQLKNWIARGSDDAGRKLVLLDTRNREETAYGSFAGALTLPIDNFTELPEALEPHRAALRDATVVSFCTGGIRCEKAALWMRGAGFGDVLQLEGGILGYFEHAGETGYDGRCFVFDERIALDPQLRPLVDPPPESV